MAWLIRVSHAEGELVLRDVPGLSTVAELKESVVAELGLPPAEHHAMRLCRRGRDLQDACVVHDELGGAVSREVHLSVLWRLVGGKGGFGSMLRAMGSQRSGHETDNIESMRDLSGRRVRHVNDEKKLAEWMAKAPEREAEKRRRKQEKREKAMTAPKHTFDHHKLAVEMHDAASTIDEGVRQGFEAAMERQRKLLQGEDAAVERKPKKARISGWDESDSETSSIEDAELATAERSTSDAAASVRDGKATAAANPKDDAETAASGEPAAQSSDGGNSESAGQR